MRVALRIFIIFVFILQTFVPSLLFAEDGNELHVIDKNQLGTRSNTSNNTTKLKNPIFENNLNLLNDGHLNNFFKKDFTGLTTRDVQNGFRKPSTITKHINKNFVEGEVLIKFKTDRLSNRVRQGLENGEFRVDDRESLQNSLRSHRPLRVRGIRNQTTEQLIKNFKFDPEVEYVQPNFIYEPVSIDTNDTYKDLLWGLDNFGQNVNETVGIIDADIDAPEAWNISEGNNKVIVSVIDSGVAYNHTDLIGSMWDGSNCIDENNNFLGGCNHGYDFEDNDKTPLPDNSNHGTHIAGTISAIKNNNTGIIGVSPNAKIMAIKSRLTTEEIDKGIKFSENNGAKIINASWGGGSTTCDSTWDFDKILYDSIDNFSGLFIVAAGNTSTNHDGSTYFDAPADYGHDTGCWSGLDNVISVAATDQEDNIASFSDYGDSFIDVGAPGVNIYSTATTINPDINFHENFNSTSPPDIGNKFLQSGTTSWGTLPFTDGSGNAITSDYANWGNYRDNIISNIDSLPINLSGNKQSALQYNVACDSEDGFDGIIVNFWNGSNWDVIGVHTGSLNSFMNISLLDYQINDFKVRFTWLTDESNPVPYYGCLLDNIIIGSFNDNDGSSNEYIFGDGTSYATPHVVGLAGLIWGFNSNLTTSEVKNIILSTGDPLPSLNGKTVTGKRINAFNALESLVPPIISNVEATSTTATSTKIRWDTDEPSTSKVKYSTTTPVASTIVSDDTLVTEHELDLTDLIDGTTYYFYVESTDEDGNTTTSTEQLFTTPVLPDETPPTLLEVTPVPTPTNDTTPDYTFNSNEPGTITYLGSCTSTTTDALVGDTVVTFSELTDGTYSDCTLTVIDTSQNTSTPLAITEFTIDTVPPILTLHGTSTIEVEANAEYEDEGASALDNLDGDISSSIVVGGDVVDTSVPGEYVITYNVTDAAGNVADEITRTVTVVDTGLPIITLLGGEEITIEVGTEYIDSGATAFDSIDGDISSSIVASSTVDINTIGTYSVSYSVSDSSGNAAEEVTRIVHVVDTTIPIITLLGESSLTINVGDAYSDSGATALDNYDGDITGNIIVTGLPLDTSTAGTYSILYNVTDSEGNNAETVTRTVIVQNSITPDEIASLLDNGTFAIEDSSTPTSTPSITVTSQVNLNISDGAGTSTVLIKEGTVITASDGSNFDATTITASSTASISGLGSSEVADGVLQWGIENLGLDFSIPITMSIFVGTDLNGETLTIKRSTSGSSSWTSDGIVDPATCVVADGYCNFSATKASYYVATHTEEPPAPTPPPSSGGGGGGGGGSSGGGGGGGTGAVAGSVIVHTQELTTISNSSVLITWFTNIPETSRVVYDTISHNPVTALGPNWGYATSTALNSEKKTFHSMTINGLDLAIHDYYFRPLSNPIAGGSGMGEEMTTKPDEGVQVLGLRSDGLPGTGALVKTENNSSVYLIDGDSRKAFPHESIFFSHYKNFNGVITLTSEELASYHLSKNVTYNTNSLIKIQSDPKVYRVVNKSGLMEWIETEEKAKELFGDDWAKQVYDVPVTFWLDYKIVTL